MKQGLKKITHGSIRTRLVRILKAYRLTPHSTTGMSPAEMLLGRHPKSRLDLIKPMTADRVEAKQLNQKSQHDARSKDRCFQEGDTVFVRNFQTGDKWLLGVISKQTGPVSYMVKLTNGRERHCHQDQLQKRTVDVTPEDPVQIDNPIPRVIGDQNGKQTLVEPPVVAPDGDEVPAQPVLDPPCQEDISDQEPYCSTEI